MLFPVRIKTKNCFRLLIFPIMFAASLLFSPYAGGGEQLQGTQQFKDYWYRGKAEITRYELHQSRYGEMHKGDAVLIFVTEDFLVDKQVKHEFGDRANAVSVMKLNFTRKFNTGIYPYSVMTSVFTPVDTIKYPRTFKTTTTSQEWCGHTFGQLNLRNGKYNVEIRSYFQRESDQDYSIRAAMLEDEIWTLIRLKPDSLPVGMIDIVPGSQFVRFRHVPLKVEKAKASLKTVTDPSLSGNELSVYSIEYKNIERRMVIKFENSFPYRIVAWEETTPSGFAKNVKILTTKAVMTHSLYTDYWTKNKVKDISLREELGLR